MTVSQMKKSTDTYFAQRQAENASRPDHLPPSQGGKYGGFGSQGSMPVKQDDSLLADALSNLTTGIQVFAEATTKVAVTARDSIQSNVIDPTREKLAEGNLWNSISEAAINAGEAVKSTALKAGESIRGASQSGRSRGPGRSRSGASVDGSDFFASFGQEDNDARENPSQDSSQDWNDDFASKKQAPARSRSGASRVSSKPKASIKPKGNDDDWGNDW
eukprot:m.439193 g.439193  ORF g.439193 m.439193 type:complete len:218 (+) comp18347_c0_seq1:459-1112(+)